jgi:hypothetical protein
VLNHFFEVAHNYQVERTKVTGDQEQQELEMKALAELFPFSTNQEIRQRENISELRSGNAPKVIVAAQREREYYLAIKAINAVLATIYD